MHKKIKESKNALQHPNKIECLVRDKKKGPLKQPLILQV